MTINSEEAARLAGLLAGDLRMDNARQRLLCVAEVLRRLTDSGHALSNADIRKVLTARFGEEAVPAENTLNADIRALRDANCLGLRVHTCAAGTWCEGDGLTPADVRLLLNAVQSSRLLSQEQSVRLQDGLGDLVSVWQEDDLVGEVHVDQRASGGSQRIFDATNAIARAMRAGRKVEFEYAFTGFDGRQVALEGDDGNTLRVETPVALLFADNRYYLESYSDPAWRHGIRLMRSRVDRMLYVRVSEQPAERCREVDLARRSVAKRVREGFDMMDGEGRCLFLRVRADFTNEMLDRFGPGLAYGCYEGEIGDPETTAVTFVRVAQAGTFYRWLTGTGGGVALVRPQSELWVNTGPWKRKLRDVPFPRLVADHEAMAEGYREYLAKAARAVE